MTKRKSKVEPKTTPSEAPKANPGPIMARALKNVFYTNKEHGGPKLVLAGNPTWLPMNHLSQGEIDLLVRRKIITLKETKTDG